MIIDEHNSLTVKFKQAQQNDLVAIKRTQLGPGFKLANKYLGSYNMVKVLRNNRYIVQKVSEGTIKNIYISRSYKAMDRLIKR